ncbi:uncharacterized protein [Ptychodera flava]|uniref:uncharacterized protein n=1 Tax=Ptychodera flava TaxID=63121 RepID=UPI00396A274A
MTTTSTFQGMENIEKPTSRVLNPPGGQSNFSLGWDGSEEAKQNGDQQPQAQQAQPEQAAADEATAEKVEPENPESGNPEQNIPKPDTNTAENAEPSNPAETKVATPQNESPPEQKPTEEKPQSPKKSPTSKTAPKSPTQKSPPKSPRGKTPPLKSPREKTSPPKNPTSEPKTPRAKATAPRTPRIKAPTPPPSQTPRASTPRKDDAREPKGDMVFGPLIIETRPGSGKRHYQKREVDTKGNLFGGEGAPQSDKKPGGNRRNVSTLYMGGDTQSPVNANGKATRRQYPTRESDSFAAVYCREGERGTGEDKINPITGAPESHKKHVKHQEGGNPITHGGSTGVTMTDSPSRRKPDRLKPEELPAAGVKAYGEEHSTQGGRVPPGGKSSGIF